MPVRMPRASAAPAELTAALEVLREELEIPQEYDPQVLAEAEAAARELQDVLDRAGEDLAAADVVPSGLPRPRAVDARDVPFVTIDPASSTDLDQAVHLTRTPDGWRVDYAIASLAEVVIPGGALDRDVHARAVTVYGPDRSFPLHPPVISSGVCSLLPGEDRLALVWRLDLDSAGELVDVSLTRSLVRSRAKLSYAQVQDALDGRAPLPDGAPADLPQLLAEVGAARAAREIARGGASLGVPDQEIESTPEGYRLTLRSGLAVEDHNAQISLLTGVAAAAIMGRHGVGVLRTLPPADERDVARLRATAAAMGIDWAPEETYGQVLAGLDVADPVHAAFLDEATLLFRGSGYGVLTEPLALTGQDLGAGGRTGALDPWRHAALATLYAHVTAPLRRLVDRYGLETCLALDAGQEVPTWVREGMTDVEADMSAGTGRASRFERGAVDTLEALLLQAHVGEEVDAVVVDVDAPRRRREGLEEDTAAVRRGNAQLADPAARVRIEGESLEAGTRVRARVAEVDVAARRVVLRAL